MKLKAILLAGIVSVGGAVSSQAQTEVFSANIVGFATVNVPDGFSMIANPVSGADNTLETLFADMPVNTQVFVFNAEQGRYELFSKLERGGQVGWNPSGTATLEPGQGAFINNPGAAIDITFSGEVLLGPDSNMTISSGFSIISSTVAQSGLLSSDLGFPAVVGDQVFRFNTVNDVYELYQFLSRGGQTGWNPSEPNVGLGESFFVNKAGTEQERGWNRNFDPNATN